MSVAFLTGEVSPTLSTCGLLRLLEAQSRVMNCLLDDSWLPPALHFFSQCEDPELRFYFLRVGQGGLSLDGGRSGGPTLRPT